MSDTLTNALQQSAHNSTVLQGIMNPAQINPLAGMGSAITAVQGMQGLQEKAAQQAAGQAYQGAINQQTGEFDPNEFRRRLAASGPAAMAAGAALLNTQQISSDQLKQNFDKARWVNSTAGALLQSGDFSDAAMLGALHNGVAGGILTLPEAQRQLATMPTDAAGRQRWLQEHQDTSASFAEQMTQRFGTRENIVTPQATYNTPIPPPRAGAPTITTPHGPAPGTTTTISVPVDGQGIIPTDANGRPTRTPTGYRDMPVHTGTIPGIPQGGPPQVAPAPGAPSAAPSPGLPPGAPPPLPGQQLVKGRFQQPQAQPPAATPSAATPPASTAKPPVFTSPPQGQPDLLAKDNEVRTAANLAMPDQQKRLIAGNTALQALDLASTGPGTGVTSRMYAFLQAQSPGSATPQGALSDTAWRQVLVKNLLRFAQSSSPRASTDQQLSTQIESNPNPEQLAPAIHHILVQDLGVLKRDIAQTQEMPASGAAGDVVKHVGSFSANTAPEAFMWNHYSGDERKAIIKQYTDAGQLKKLDDALELAVKRGAIPDPTRKAAPVVAPPPAPAQNPLVPTN